MDIVNMVGGVIFSAAATVLKDALVEAVEKKADLRSADLYGANLYGAYLRGANLYGADLRGADLRGANLYGADLRGAYLRGADLRGAYLRGANLYGANLRGADLRGANLYGADLRGANLRSADLYGADLRSADLRGAYLRGADGEKKKAHSIRIFSSSLYPFVVLAVLFEDGERMVKMGCLEKTLAQWKKVGIRKSNLSEFPDDKSEKCEDRVGLFNLAKAAVTRMNLPPKAKATK